MAVWPKENAVTFVNVMDILVGVAGFLNAGGLATQGYKLMVARDQTEDPSRSISVPMFLMFLFIQTVYTVRGFQNHDKLLAGGMIASALATIWILVLVYQYRRRRGSPRA